MSILQTFFTSYGFTISPTQADQSCVRSTYPTEWVNKYFEYDMYKHDPIFKFANDNRRRNGSKILCQSDMDNPLYEEARSYGADSNVMITDFFGGSTFVLGGVNHEFDKQELGAVENHCKILHRQEIARNISLLTDRQIDVMELVETGLRDRDIAHELGISPSGLAKHKKAICKTLRLTNFQAAAQLYTAQKWGSIIAG